ncbi:DUF1822 family protein [Geminocystis sp. GBBB08]|uniref:DUF1822 family protein n=1 Tax=Geminocystis sp. GBBB08 TaxID=2604140 RepID=UPI0027E29AA5|nr:DUF1822 family protein [Geminocystis sp. GBBB08]MBL1208910.1 DUF1822 family protein [Geminocystis sp. GBBB08]
MTNIQMLTNTYVDELKIQLSDEIKRETWQQIKQLSNEVASYRGYLNLLARKTFISWLNLMLETNILDTWQLENNLSIWEFVNGNAIDIDSNRIILIPTETQDKTEIDIPEEWLKIPDWVGNYYVAVEVNIEENYLNFWGYTSYEDLQTHGKLDSFNHTVDFPVEYLENDLNLMCLEYEYGWDMIPQIESLPLLSPQQKENLFKEIKDNLSPRLLGNFNQWLSFISNSQTRYQLFCSRQSINLSQWFKGENESTLTKGWQTLTELMQQYFVPDFSLTPVFSSRSLSIENALNILQENNDQEVVNNILKKINNVAINSHFKNDVIIALVNLIENSEEEEIRWNASLALKSLNPHHKLSGIWHGKVINLDKELASYNLGLLVGILPKKSNNHIDIFVRVYSLNQDKYLPSNLKLKILDESGTVFQEIITKSNDNIIQYKFWGNQEEKFTIKVIVNDIYIQENFSI